MIGETSAYFKGNIGFSLCRSIQSQYTVNFHPDFFRPLFQCSIEAESRESPPDFSSMHLLLSLFVMIGESISVITALLFLQTLEYQVSILRGNLMLEIFQAQKIVIAALYGFCYFSFLFSF